MGITATRCSRTCSRSVGLNAMFDLMSKRIDNWGHFGGFLGGAVVAWTVGPTSWLWVLGEGVGENGKPRSEWRRRVVNRPLLQTWPQVSLWRFRVIKRRPDDIGPVGCYRRYEVLGCYYSLA